MNLRASLSPALRALRAARRDELQFAARAWLLAIPVEISLATLGLKRTLAWVERLSSHGEDGARGGESVGVEAGELWVARAYRLQPLGGECLPRSLVQYALHRRDGTPARFVVGVRHDQGLAAHAWVEAIEESPPARTGRRNAEFAPLLVTEPSA